MTGLKPGFSSGPPYSEDVLLKDVGYQAPRLGQKLGFPLILPLSLPPLRPSQELSFKADSSRLAVTFRANQTSRLGFPLWIFAFC